MSKGLLSNPKAALVFAGITIVSAIVMVGPQGGGGVLDQAVGRIGQQSEPGAEQAPTVVQEEPSKVAEPLDPADGWGGTADPVFGEFTEEPIVETPAEEAAELAPAPVRAASRVYEQTVQVGGPVVADAPGIVVPGDDDALDKAASRAIPVVTSRRIKIQPQ
jgi:hypothetical protein